MRTKSILLCFLLLAPLVASADVNQQDAQGYTPLMDAVMAGDKEKVKSLIAEGADVSLKNKKGMTAMDIAKFKNYREILELLRRDFISKMAYELVILNGETSKNSKRWKEEVFPGYANSEVGKTLPAKIVTFQGYNFPNWIAGAIQESRIGEIVGTPTFIIWDVEKKQEVGRVEGYTEKPKFYSKMKEALAMVKQGMHPGQREGSGGDHREEGSGGAQRQEEGSPTSKDIMDHMYKTPEEAKLASEMLGLGGEIHSHETPNGTIYMPGSTM